VRTLIIAVICLAGPRALSAQTLDVTRSPHVVVRSYTHGMSPADFARARGFVGDLFAGVGIGVSWVECGSDESAADPPADCSRPLKDRELIVRIVAGETHSISDPSALGYSLVDLEVAQGSIATVYIDRVTALARRAQVETAGVLGRAIAHEMGHLLIGSNRHASQGLMRATWAPRELRRNAAIDWQFSESEGQTMRGRLRLPMVDAAEVRLADAR